MTGYGLGLILAVVAAVLIAAPALVSLFLTEQDAAGMAAKGLRLFSLSLIPCVLNTAFKNFYQGVDRTGFTQAISVMQNFALTALFAFLLSRFWGVDGIWLGYLFGEGFTWLVIVAVVWIRHRGVSFSADAFSMLPKDFGAREGDYMEMTLQNAEDPVQASVKAEEFCLGHGESRRNSSMIALCVEEMTNNIIRHGFTKDKKKHSIDIRLLFKGDKRLLRIRDDCVNFDPVDYVKLHESEDPTSHIGIRMVMKMVKNANYINSLGLNISVPRTFSMGTVSYNSISVFMALASPVRSAWVSTNLHLLYQHHRLQVNRLAQKKWLDCRSDLRYNGCIDNTGTTLSNLYTGEGEPVYTSLFCRLNREYCWNGH
jgi:anti-sigma regulatory factor (Ser/Thr protein kinase)